MSSRNRFIAGFVIVSLFTILVVHWWGYKSPHFGVDDANIYFVYMKNFAEGHGFVWNVGGERVEGFTSLVWTLFGALMYKISASHFNTLLLIANFILCFFTIRSVLLFSGRFNNTQHSIITPADILIVSLLLLPLGFFEWSVTSLMETGLWTFLIVHLTLQLCSYYMGHSRFNYLKFSAMIVLLDMTRPESIALSLVFIGLLFLIYLAERGVKPAITVAVVPLLAHIVTFISIIAWRISYFGYPFPNTYYAKVSGDHVYNLIAGFKYLLIFFHTYPHAAFIVGLLVVILGFLVMHFRKGIKLLSNDEKILTILLVVIFAGLSLPVLTGGDHFRYSRFYQPYLPLAYLTVTSSFIWRKYFGLYIEKRGVAMRGLLMSAAFSALFFSKFTILDFTRGGVAGNDNILIDFSIAQKGREIGEDLNKTFQDIEYPSLGALATGSIAYSYKGETIDLLGLNNTTMAHASKIKEGYRNHASFDKGGFWKLKPDVLGTFIGAEIVKDTTLFVLPENTREYRTSSIVYQCYKGIFDDAEFRSEYTPALVRNKNTDFFIFSYYRQKFLSSLQHSDAYVVKTLKRKKTQPATTHVVVSGGE